MDPSSQPPESSQFTEALSAADGRTKQPQREERGNGNDAKSGEVSRGGESKPKYFTAEEAMASLSKLTKRDFIELRNLPSPPEGVLSVARGLCWALGVKLRRRSTTDGIVGDSETPQEYWRAAREHIFPSSSAITLLQRLVFFDRDRVPDKTIELLRGLVETEAFQKEMMFSNLAASKALGRWLSHVVDYRLSKGGQGGALLSRESSKKKGKVQRGGALSPNTVQREKETSPGIGPRAIPKYVPSKFLPHSRRSPTATATSAGKKKKGNVYSMGPLLSQGLVSSPSRIQEQLGTLQQTKPDSTGASPDQVVEEQIPNRGDRSRGREERSRSPARSAGGGGGGGVRNKALGKAIPIQWRSAPRLDQPLSARSNISAKLSVRDQIWYKEKDSWRQALDEARREIRELKALESRILWNMRREEKSAERKMEKEAQKDITQWRREQETSLREGIEAFRRTTHQRELKENLEFVQFKRERKRRAREAELELITQSYDAQREKSIQRENCEKERITADEVFKAEQRKDREETRKLVRALKEEEARKEQAERLYNSAEKMEYEKRQLLAEKNRRLKDLQLMSALCRRVGS